MHRDLQSDFLVAARQLGPNIEAVADQIERERQLPAELVEKLLDAGLFRMLLPKSLGGFELGLPAYVRVVEELARADASVAWCVGQANGLWHNLAYADRTGAETVTQDGRAILANGPGEGNRPGTARQVESGFSVSGRWMFASGINHATWLLAICNVITANGQTAQHGEITPNGQPTAEADATRYMLFPKSAATLHDVWHVSGLRGTGSQSFSVEDVFVPAELAVCIAPETRRERGPLYLFGSSGYFGPSFGAVALGIAHTCLAAIVDFAAGKVPRGMDRSIRENAVVQSSVALVQARLGAARTYLYATLSEMWQQVTAENQLHLDQQVAVRLAATHATHEAAAVVDTAYSLAGSNAIFANLPFERRFRDMHAVTQQLQGRRAHYETVGKHLLGLEVSRAFL